MMLFIINNFFERKSFAVPNNAITFVFLMKQDVKMRCVYLR